MPSHPDITDAQQTALRSWLRLLGTSNAVRKSLQSSLRTAHGVSLSRFDILANLYRAPREGVRLSVLSKQLMVSNGNVTQVMAPLIKEGFIERRTCTNDARAAVARLTPNGRRLFEGMATDHARWVDDIFGALSPNDHLKLIEIMNKLNVSDS